MLHWLRRAFAPSEPDLPEVPAAQWARIEARLPFLDFLDPVDRPALRELARRFVATKEFHGAHDTALSDDMLLEIALQACLPVLRLGLDWYDDWVGVVVYPGDFIVPRRVTDDAGVVHEYEDTLVGEAWEGGPVLLSWQPESLAADGINVVIHEFAHKLDMENGGADGFPRLPAGMSRRAWADAFSSAYDDLCEDVDAGRDNVLDPYAAESPGEFFAVASEAFFETPVLLAARYPAVYAQLAAFYGTDPAAGERRLVGRSSSAKGPAYRIPPT